MDKRIPVPNAENELLSSMINVSKSGNGPENQNPSMGCSIKWFS